jgi:p24 family protein beta-1
MSSNKYFLSLAAIVCVLCVYTASSVTALTFQIEPQTEECIHEELNSGQSFSMEYEVIRGGLLDIHLRIYNPKNRMILEKMVYFSKKNEAGEPEEEGQVQFVASFSGTHKVCFNNVMSRWTAKVVTIKSFGENANDKANDVAKLESLGPIVDSVIKISDDLETIERLQRHIRIRERQHRDLTDSINSRVQWLSVLQGAMLIAIAVFQFRYIQHWFIQTRGHPLV